MFKVYAVYTSALSGAERRFELVTSSRGHVFKAMDTGTSEAGTYSEDENKFACLDLFRSIFREMSPRFELV